MKRGEVFSVRLSTEAPDQAYAGGSVSGPSAEEPVRPDSSIEELIEASSLGTPAAKSIRESVPIEVAQEVVRRAKALAHGGLDLCTCWPHGPDEPCTCEGCWTCSGAVVGCTCDIDWDCGHLSGALPEEDE